jgi:hypothetical protein
VCARRTCAPGAAQEALRATVAKAQGDVAAMRAKYGLAA